MEFEEENLRRRPNGHLRQRNSFSFNFKNLWNTKTAKLDIATAGKVFPLKIKTKCGPIYL